MSSHFHRRAACLWGMAGLLFIFLIVASASSGDPQKSKAAGISDSALPEASAVSKANQRTENLNLSDQFDQEGGLTKTRSDSGVFRLVYNCPGCDNEIAKDGPGKPNSATILVQLMNSFPFGKVDSALLISMYADGRMAMMAANDAVVSDTFDLWTNSYWTSNYVRVFVQHKNSPELANFWPPRDAFEDL